MKKFLLIASMFAIVCVGFVQKSEAQTFGNQFYSITNLVYTGNSLTRDTVTNTGVKALGMLISNGAMGQGQNGIGIQVDITKISGTAGGTIVPIASIDGVNWGVVGSGTYTVTNSAMQSCVFSVPIGFNFYGFQYTGTGTMVCSVTGRAVRKTSY